MFGMFHGRLKDIPVSDCHTWHSKILPDLCWSYLGRRAESSYRNWRRFRYSPPQPGCPSDLLRHTNRWERPGWRVGGTGSTASCVDSERMRRWNRAALLNAALICTHPGILFMRTIVLMNRAATFLPLGRMWRACTFQLAETHTHTGSGSSLCLTSSTSFPLPITQATPGLCDRKFSSPQSQGLPRADPPCIHSLSTLKL